MSCLLLSFAAAVNAAPPRIDHPPRHETVILYEQAALGVIAAGTPPLTYQWFKDGIPIPGADADQWVVSQCRFTNAGAYSVVVVNAEGNITSPVALLAVNPPRAGDVDFSFKWGKANSGYVYAIAVQVDGRILLGGNFSALQGVTSEL